MNFPHKPYNLPTSLVPLGRHCTVQCTFFSFRCTLLRFRFDCGRLKLQLRITLNKQLLRCRIAFQHAVEVTTKRSACHGSFLLFIDFVCLLFVAEVHTVMYDLLPNGTYFRFNPFIRGMVHVYL